MKEKMINYTLLVINTNGMVPKDSGETIFITNIKCKSNEDPVEEYMSNEGYPCDFAIVLTKNNLKYLKKRLK